MGMTMVHIVTKLRTSQKEAMNSLFMPLDFPLLIKPHWQGVGGWVDNLLYYTTAYNHYGAGAVEYTVFSVWQWKCFAKVGEKGVIIITIQFYVKSKRAGCTVGHIVFRERIWRGKSGDAWFLPAFTLVLESRKFQHVLCGSGNILQNWDKMMLL